MKALPQCRIGTSKRNTFSNKQLEAVPPPNAYNVYNAQTVLNKSDPKTFFGSGKRNYARDTRDVPGPGTYSISSRAVEGKHISLSGRFKDPAKFNVPGAGTYD